MKEGIAESVCENPVISMPAPGAQQIGADGFTQERNRHIVAYADA